MGLVEVRLTIRPGETVRIHEGDVPQLAHQGLLAGEPVPVPEPGESEPPAPVTRKTPKGGKRAAVTEGTQP